MRWTSPASPPSASRRRSPSRASNGAPGSRDGGRGFFSHWRGRDHGHAIGSHPAREGQGQADVQDPGGARAGEGGLTARGIIYILIGWVAVLVALGHGRHEADQQGALQLLAGKPYGTVSLWLLGIGFAAYALWRLGEAAYGVTGEGNRAGPRLRSLGRAVVYAGFALLTFQVIAGAQASQSRQQQDVTARVMQHPGGRWLVGIAGLIIVLLGLVLVTEGLRRKFMKYLRTSQMSPGTRRIVWRLGVIGTIARGAVVALVGILVIDAAVTHTPAESGGIDKALLTLRNQPVGPVLLLAAALGLVIFGIYGLCEARWRRV